MKPLVEPQRPSVVSQAKEFSAQGSGARDKHYPAVNTVERPPGGDRALPCRALGNAQGNHAMNAESASPSPENNAQNPPTPVPTTPPVSVPIPGPTMEERLSGPPSKAGDRISTDDLAMEHRIRWRCQTNKDEEAAAAVGEDKKTIARAIKQYDGPLLIQRRPSKRKNRWPLPPHADNAETSTDD